jgi:hypothetical protein
MVATDPSTLADSLTVATESQPLPEYKLKAAFLVRFFNFIRWPETAAGLPTRSVRIGILGEDPFGHHFDAVEGSSVDGRPLEVKRFHTLKELEPCHILFVASSAQPRVRDVLKAVAGTSTLTVGETSDFIEQGGMIRFYAQGDRIRLYINPAALEHAGLKPNAKLLDLATLPPGHGSSESGREP